MKELLQAIKNNNLNYVANNLRFIKFLPEEYILSLNISPTTEMTLCLVHGAKIKEEVPHQKLVQVCLRGEFSELGKLLEAHTFSTEILEYLEEFSINPIVKKMLKLILTKKTQTQE